MTSTIAISVALLASSMTRYLDPWTSLWQTDDAKEAAPCMREAGYWPTPQGVTEPDRYGTPARIIHHVFRKLDAPAKDYDPAVPSPLFKINEVGYLPDAPKFAYIGAWLGPKLGAWEPHGKLEAWRLVSESTGEAAYVSPTPPRLRIDDGTTKEGVPFTGEDTYEMDFSSVTNEGTYYIEIPNLGRSASFRIAGSSAEDAWRIHMQGLYQKRCGTPKEMPYTHWTCGACHTNVVRGRFASEEGTLQPKKNWFEIIRCSTDWEHGKRLNVSGGWHDAADYDRRIFHLNAVNDLCAVYLMRPENFRDGQLNIPEQANGIPDILDEAEWGLRHLLAVQEPSGGVGVWIETTGHPKPGNIADKDTMQYAVARHTRRSSMAYAAHAALLARCHASFREKYLASAIKAWDFAISAEPQTDVFEIKKKKWKVFEESEFVTWTEGEDIGAQYLVKAAINLHALTGDSKYLDPLAPVMDKLIREMDKAGWKWSALTVSGEVAAGEIPQAAAKFVNRWRGKTINIAKDMLNEIDSAYAYHVPWHAPRKGWVQSMSWGMSQPLRRAQTLIAAHGFTKDPRYLAAASLANDFHNGCNPNGTTLTSGLGRTYPVCFLDLPSYVDGIAEYVPGITPYRWTYGLNPNVIKEVYGDDKAMACAWPIWRRWGNLENRTVAASEFTIWETIAPAASVTGYLIDPARTTPPPPARVPAKSIKDLPGYWTLP